MAGGRRVDVHGVHTQSVRYISGQICGGDQTRELPKHNEQEASEGLDSWSLGTVFCDLLPAASWVER